MEAKGVLERSVPNCFCISCPFRVHIKHVDPTWSYGDAFSGSGIKPKEICQSFVVMVGAIVQRPCIKHCITVLVQLSSRF